MGEVNYTCHTCHGSIDSGDECADCQNLREYWSALTPEERESERSAMALYVSEADY